MSFSKNNIFWFWWYTFVQSAKKEEHIYRDEMMSFPIGIGNRIVARRLQKNRMRFHPPPPFRWSKTKALCFFLTWWVLAKRSLCSSRTSVGVRKEREREREREKVASARQSKTKKRSSSSSKIDLIKKVPRTTTNVRLCKKRDGSRWWSAITAGWFPLGTRTFRCLLLRPWLMMMMMMMMVL